MIFVILFFVSGAFVLSDNGEAFKASGNNDHREIEQSVEALRQREQIQRSWERRQRRM